MRGEMRRYWQLPEEMKMDYRGPDWLLILLAQLDPDQKQNVLLLLWRAWLKVHLGPPVSFG
jgi:hypothetical protein